MAAHLVGEIGIIRMNSQLIWIDVKILIIRLYIVATTEKQRELLRELQFPEDSMIQLFNIAMDPNERNEIGSEFPRVICISKDNSFLDSRRITTKVIKLLQDPICLSIYSI